MIKVVIFLIALNTPYTINAPIDYGYYTSNKTNCFEAIAEVKAKISTHIWPDNKSITNDHKYQVIGGTCLNS